MTKDQLLRELLVERFAHPVHEHRSAVLPAEPADEFTAARHRKDLDGAVASLDRADTYLRRASANRAMKSAVSRVESA